jgi:hypothetical protein
MIFDVTCLLSNAQAIVATAPSTNYYDIGPSGTVYGAASAIVRDVGKGEPIPFRVQIVETFNTLTSLTVSLETDDNTAFGTPITVLTSPAIPLATLVAGYWLQPFDYLPRGLNERYFQMRYTVTGTVPTLGKITAGVVAKHQNN